MLTQYEKYRLQSHSNLCTYCCSGTLHHSLLCPFPEMIQHSNLAENIRTVKRVESSCRVSEMKRRSPISVCGQWRQKGNYNSLFLRRQKFKVSYRIIRIISCPGFVHTWDLAATPRGQKYKWIQKLFDKLMEKYICQHDSDHNFYPRELLRCPSDAENRKKRALGAGLYFVSLICQHLAIAGQRTPA